MATNTHIKGAEDHADILSSGQGCRPPRVEDPIPQGVSLAADARDTNTPLKRKKALTSPEGQVQRRKSRAIHHTDNSDSDSEPEARWVFPQIEKPKDVRPPRYLVVESDDPDKPFNRLHIFAVGCWFEGVATGLSKKIKKLGSGFEVDCETKREACLLLKRNNT